MPDDDRRDPEDLSLESARRIDHICDEFEDACRTGRIPSIEFYLERLDKTERPTLVGELLPLELDFRRLAGEEPSLSEYLTRFVAYAPIVRKAFAGLATHSPEPVDADEVRGLPAGNPGEPRFRILESHARGGLGHIWLAEDLELDRRVALKDIRQPLADDPQSRSRFVREAKITGQLEHPGIVPVYGLGCHENGRPFYAMKLVRGITLKEAIDQFHANDRRHRKPRKGRLELRKLLGRFVEVCNAVAYAHSRGVLHRDLKPENVMLGEFGETLVVDWGLAKVLGEAAEKNPDPAAADATDASRHIEATAAGSTVGTPQYMSPEQAAGRHNELTPASDVYSLGATLYCLLVGQPAFPSTDDVESNLAKVRSGDFSTPRRKNPRVPAALEAICLKAMSHARGDRYASARELADDVENWLADEQVRAYHEPALERLVRWSRRHRSWVRAGLVSATVVLLAIVAVLIYWSRLPGTLVVTDPPAGMRIDVAGRTYFVEGDRVELHLPPGIYQARISAPDYVTENHELFVERGKEKPVPRLQHEQGWLTAECDPLGSEIEVDGVAYGSRIVNLRLDTGPHKLRAWRNGHFDSQLDEIRIQKDATTQARFALDEGVVWQQRSLAIQSMAIPVYDSADQVTGIVHDELHQVVCRSPLNGTALWTLPLDPQRHMRLIDLGGKSGPILIIGTEMAAKDGKPASMSVQALSPNQELKSPESELEYVWRWHVEVKRPWATARGLSFAAVPDLDDDGVRDLAVAGRDGKLHIIGGDGGKVVSTTELVQQTAQETPSLYPLSGSSSKLVAFRIEPGHPDNDRKPFPKPLTIGCADVGQGTVVWTRSLDSVAQLAVLDVDADGTAEMYWRNDRHWQILDTRTGGPKGDGEPWEGRPRNQRSRQQVYFADVDGDDMCEMIEILRDNEDAIIARRIPDGQVIWSGPTDVLSHQPIGPDGRLLTSPEGELLIFCRSSLVALHPATGKPAWEVDGRPEGVVIGQWDNLGKDEIFVGSRGRGIVCLGADGGPRWTLRMPLGIRPLVILPDVDADGLNEVVINEHAALLGLARGPRILWKQEASGPLLASPQAVDLDRDGQPEVCQVGRWDSDTYCRCFEGRNGAVRWSVEQPFPNNRAQAVYDWDSDEENHLDYVVLGYGNNRPDLRLHVFRGADGIPLADHRIEEPNALYTTPGIGDFTGDGHPDIAAVRWDRRDVIAIDGKQGEIYWRFPTRAENMGGVAVDDVDGDGRDDVVATASYREENEATGISAQPIQGVLIALRGRKAQDGESQEMWVAEVGLPMRSMPRLYDLDGDGTPEILAISQIPPSAAEAGTPTRSRLNIVSHDGKPLWTTLAATAATSEENVSVIGRPEVARVDGNTWIVTAMGNDGIAAFDYELREQVWQTTAGVRVISTPVIDDLDGDGKREVVATTVDGELLVMDLRTGKRLWQLKISDNYISGSPAIGDLNGDGIHDIVVSDHGFTLTAVNGLSTRAARARGAASPSPNH